MKIELTNEQLKVANRIFLIGLIVQYMVVLLTHISMLVSDTLPHARSSSIQTCIVILVCLLGSIFGYVKFSSNKIGKYILCVFSVIYEVAGVYLNDPRYTYVFIFVVMVLCTIYIDVKVSMIVNIGLSVFTIVRIILCVVQGTLEGNIACINIVIISLMCTAICLVARFSYNVFVQHTEEIRKNLDKQQEVVMAVSNTVNQVFNDYTDAMKELKNLTQQADQNRISMHEIAEGMETTAEEIQNQVASTTDIQVIIKDTERCASQIEEKVDEVILTVNKGVGLSDELSEQSKIVDNNTKEMSSIITKLNTRVEDVSGIVQTILSISEQTNLLALNASIEAARAGEAGKGFAVVANEIRNLAEGTKKSTEKITDIINELKETTNDTYSILAQSVESINEQGDKVNKVNQEFTKTGIDMKTLENLIKEIGKQLKIVFTSNEKIVESISQLSAISEEITGSAQSGVDISNVVIDKIKYFDQQMDKIFYEINDLKEKV